MPRTSSDGSNAATGSEATKAAGSVTTCTDSLHRAACAATVGVGPVPTRARRFSVSAIDANRAAQASSTIASAPFKAARVRASRVRVPGAVSSR